MPFSVLGLQAAVADGSEPTFDGQPMQPGIHLRWSFAPELGFPAADFWLARREASGDEAGPIEPPVAVSEATSPPSSPGTPDPSGLGGIVTVGSASPSSSSSSSPCGRCCCCVTLATLEERSGSQARPAR